MSKQKDIRLRAFSIVQNTNITTPITELTPVLKDKLSVSIAKDRMRKRSSSDIDKEHDLISYSKYDRNTIFGVMLRVELDSTSPQVSTDLLESQFFSLSDLQDGHEESTVYRSHYYFCLNDSFLITNLPGNTTIAGFQTYLNWLLDTATSPYELTPLCKSAPDVKLSDIKEVVFEDSYILSASSAGRAPTSIEDTDSKLIDVASGMLRSVFSQVVDLTEEELKQVVSARLLLKLRKPRDMSEEDYQRKFGAMLKPIADTEHLQYVSKKGKRITAEDITVTKDIKVETTGRGFLDEEQLRQTMLVFLNEQET